MLFAASINKSRGLLILVITGLFLFSGFMYEIGPDWRAYRSIYMNISDIYQQLNEIDLFIILISKIGRHLEYDWVFVQIVHSFFTLCLIYLSLNKINCHKYFGWFVYMSIPNLFLMSTVGIRQSLAVAIILTAISMLIMGGKKFYVYSLFFISSLIHLSSLIPSIIVIIFYKYLKTPYSNFFYIFLIITSLILGKIDLINYLMNFVTGKYEFYIMENAPDVSVIRLMLNNIIFLIFLLYKRNIFNDNRFVFFINFFLVGVLILNLTMGNVYISRLYIYFEVVLIVLIPKVIYIQSNNIKILYMATFIIYLTLYYLYAVHEYFSVYGYKNYLLF